MVDVDGAGRRDLTTAGSDFDTLLGVYVDLSPTPLLVASDGRRAFPVG